MGGSTAIRIRILTSCTGEKAVTHPHALTHDDFARGPAHIARREKALADLLTPAEDLYSGQQHVRLMRGVRALRTAAEVDVAVLSAGYGLVFGSWRLAPYECTFTGMKRRELDAWSAALGIPMAVRAWLAVPCDLAFVLLGDDYLRAAALADATSCGGSTLVLCSSQATARLPQLPGLRPVPLSTPEARRFSCGLVGLKGEVVGRLLERLAVQPALLQRILDPQVDLLSLADDVAPERRTRRPPREPRPEVDQVITLPGEWRRRHALRRPHYFIPEWDDLVDPDYDFLRDEHSGGRGHWSNQVYAHQMYPEPNYDGILISRLVAEKLKDKRARINALGVHRYLRVPPEFPVMGDCGAFGYISEEKPPYQTDEILDYYTRLGFDLGVSIDHLIVTETEDQRRFRYDLTIQNAADFLRGHRAQRLSWEPVGAVQGWDPASYAYAACGYVKMGYRYLALGGLVRSTTHDILQIVEAVRAAVPSETKIHLFGLARFAALREFARLGVTSIDSSSVLRKAWLGSTMNYLTPDGWYAAIRVPQPDGCFRAKRLIEQGERTAEDLHRLEAACLGGLRTYAAGKEKRPSTALLDRLTEYDVLLAGERGGVRERIRRTLEDRPWQACGCAICDRAGVEVLVFRGNNRNRRRGFHNTHVFYRLMGRILAGERIGWVDGEPAGEQQGLLF